MLRNLFAAVSSTLASVVVTVLLAASTQAQSIIPAPDGTGTVVNINGQQFKIEGGTLSGDSANLFHSFEKFGLSADQIATFLSNPSIQNILARVVGGDASIINGLLQVTGGNSSLYLLNPAGIVFGPNARLDVPASFTVTTATGIGFGNGNWFNAIGPNDYAHLVGNPTSFAFALAQPGAIVNAGQLAVSARQSITLLGGMVINTGTISTPDGNLTIAAVPGEKLIRITPAGSLLSLDLPIETKALLNPSGSTFNALALPELLTGSNAVDTGLQVVDGAVQLPNGAIPVQVGDVGITQQLTAGQLHVSARNDVSIVAGQLRTTGDMNLLADQTVRVRDTQTQPVLIKAGRNLTIQGNQNIDILALQHPETPFQSGGNLKLISNGNISGDSHFSSWGNFSIETLAGNPGNFVSLYDPLIVTGGDVSMGDYTGVSLGIVAIGDITTGSITITGPDTTFAVTSAKRIERILALGRAVYLEAGAKPSQVESLLEPPVVGTTDVNYTDPAVGRGRLQVQGNISGVDNAAPLRVDLLANSDISFKDITSNNGNITVASFTGSISAQGKINTTGTGNGGEVFFYAVFSDINLNNNITTSGQLIALAADRVQLGNDVTLDSTNNGMSPIGADIKLTTGLATSGDRTLTLMAGIQGNLFLRAIDIDTLDLVSGNQLFLKHNVTTNKALDFTRVGAIRLLGDVTLTAQDKTQNNALQNITLGSQNIITGARNLGFNGDLVTLAQVGDGVTNPLSLNVNANSVQLNGNVKVDGLVSLTANTGEIHQRANTSIDTTGVKQPRIGPKFEIDFSGDTPNLVKEALLDATEFWSTQFSNDVTITIKFVFSPVSEVDPGLDPNTIGTAVPLQSEYAYTDFRNALQQNATSPDDYSAIANLPNSSNFKLLINYTEDNPNGVRSSIPYLDTIGGNTSLMDITAANAKVLGLPVSGEEADVDIVFDNGKVWDFEPNGQIAKAALSLDNLALHETGHGLGFVSGLDELDGFALEEFPPFPDDLYAYVQPLDFFRFSEKSTSYGRGVIDWTAGAPAGSQYFSTDGGLTPIAPFSTGVNFGDGETADHWQTRDPSIGVMDPLVRQGRTLPVTQTDLRAFDVIGWNLATSPQPATQGGAVTLSAQGDVSTGNIVTRGGSVMINAADGITTGLIHTENATAAGGNVNLRSNNTITVTAINAQGGETGKGGAVNIETNQNFRATGTFTDRNGVLASISTAGGLGGGDIRLQHGNGAFVVGNSAVNGTAGAITSGEYTIFPYQVLFGSHTLGNLRIRSDADVNANLEVDRNFQRQILNDGFAQQPSVPVTTEAAILCVDEQALPTQSSSVATGNDSAQSNLQLRDVNLCTK